MLDLNDLRLFVHIVEHRGILKAGRALQLPKSTISRRLASLEEQLKTRLIVRSGEDFRLTAAGEEVYALARAMVEAAQRAEERLMRPIEAVRGKVSISVASLFVPCLPDYVGHITSSYPELSLVLDVAERDLDQNGDGFDLHLCAHHWTLRDSALIQRRVCRNPTMLVAAPGLGLDPDAASSPAALQDVDLFAYGNAGQADWDFTDASGAVERYRGTPRLICANVETLRALALAGAGVSLLPEFGVRAQLAAGTLVRVAPDWRGPTVTVSLLSPPRRLMNTTLRRAADELAACVKSTILSQNSPLVQSVQDTGAVVPDSHPGDFTQVSSATPSPTGHVASTAMSVPDPNLAESETPMQPFLKAFGAAAIGASSMTVPAAAQDAPGPLVLYTNDFEGVITERFEADTGREIDVVQMSGGEILARIAAEASNPQWDVLIFNGSYSFHSLDQQDQLLRGVEPTNLDNLNELGRALLPEDRSWFPIGQAASCVMLYRTDLVEEPPADFADLADPRFNGLFGMADPAVAAPAYPCVAQFFHALGQERAEELFTSYFDNGMRVYRTNGPVGQALSSGDLSLALITSQVAYSLIAAGEVPAAVVWPEAGAPGVVRGVGIQAETDRREAATAFVEWLLEPETQTYLAEAVPSDGMFEPTVTGAVRRADGPEEGLVYLMAPDDFSVANEAEIKTWFADRALN